MSRTQVGRARVTRILEFQFELGTQAFAKTPPSGWLDNSDLLVPDFFDPDTDKWRIAVQSWVVEVDGLTVVVDTGVGNDRQRPHMPPLDHLNTGFLSAWDSAGIDRAAVDVVINTHIHSDHVGWNTMLDDGAWVPTFPNARYLAPTADYRYFAPDGPAARQTPRTEAEAAQQHGDQLVFADSVLPVDDAGQLVGWSDDYQISPSLRLRPAPGHTPGSSVLWLDAGQSAVFVGDLTHSPLQLRRPADPCAFDVNAGAAAATRRRIFTEAAAAHATVIPAHYPGHGGASIRAAGDQFEIDEWLEIERL
ncbi:MBL fold metallo-hydrolase [Mycobacterium montefiorense]|uniref:MBL fold metallo-hydrolase n=1 Tax=Mycobacterium montefiorense TaxID=154654 RepID=A0AA37PMC0_9MYCO|nr:MBL fold metallo-hydrolase [Mycobacterium montefiorense]GBG36940.1 MBL fold metallo-hydrolase [Mycobacterium montefiorense]GKU42530.1 MBL fold metallo-hydrolase [Mycobacterium montefiorense]GKU46318.1 MBL fold metallo-hydrolase [Mycobacterium montefiorense]GKU51098.1 MBL fold metallo-hydrolase [Mycobacterium montefiorense]GKU55122.1 MBL fold metallo-hydrolase [Mycobacterium montefiorense]